MLNRFFSKTSLAALMTATALLGVTSSPALAHYGYYHHGGFGRSVGRGLGFGLGMGVGVGLVHYALRGSVGYRYHPYHRYYPPYRAYGPRPIVTNSQTIINNYNTVPPVSVPPPAYPVPSYGYPSTTVTTVSPGYY